MAPTRTQFRELADNLRGALAVARELGRLLPPEYAPASVGVLAAVKRQGTVRMRRLAELLDVDMSVASRHVAHLAERGWIDRLPDPYDRRSRMLRLTPAGAEVLRTCSDRAADALSHRMRDWSDEDLTRFSVLLARLRTDFAGGCGPSSTTGVPRPTRPAPALAADLEAAPTTRPTAD